MKTGRENDREAYTQSWKAREEETDMGVETERWSVRVCTRG